MKLRTKKKQEKAKQDNFIKSLTVTYKCEHAVIGKDGVVSCPYRDKQKKWIKENPFIESKVAFPVCPKRLNRDGEPLVCVKYELRGVRRR